MAYKVIFIMKGFHQQIGEQEDDLITNPVAKLVVQGLEDVDVKVNHGKRKCLRVSRLQCLLNGNVTWQ